MWMGIKFNFNIIIACNNPLIKSYYIVWNERVKAPLLHIVQMTVFYRMMRIKFFYSRDAFFLQLRDVQIEKCFTTLPGAKRGRGIKWKKVNLSVNDIFSGCHFNWHQLCVESNSSRTNRYAWFIVAALYL